MVYSVQCTYSKGTCWFTVCSSWFHIVPGSFQKLFIIHWILMGSVNRIITDPKNWTKFLLFIVWYLHFDRICFSKYWDRSRDNKSRLFFDQSLSPIKLFDVFSFVCYAPEIDQWQNIDIRLFSFRGDDEQHTATLVKKHFFHPIVFSWPQNKFLANKKEFYIFRP